MNEDEWACSKQTNMSGNCSNIFFLNENKWTCRRCGWAIKEKDWTTMNFSWYQRQGVGINQSDENQGECQPWFGLLKHHHMTTKYTKNVSEPQLLSHNLVLLTRTLTRLPMRPPNSVARFRHENIQIPLWKSPVPHRQDQVRTYTTCAIMQIQTSSYIASVNNDNDMAGASGASLMMRPYENDGGVWWKCDIVWPMVMCSIFCIPLLCLDLFYFVVSQLRAPNQDNQVSGPELRLHSSGWEVVKPCRRLC